MRKTYTVGTCTVYQDVLKLGQIEFLAKRLRGVEFTFTIAGLTTLAANHFDLVACVLVPDGRTQGEHVRFLDHGGADYQEYLQLLRDQVSWVDLVAMVQDFFACNPLSVLSSAVAGLSAHLTPPPASTSDSKPSISPSRAEDLATAPTLVSPSR